MTLLKKKSVKGSSVLSKIDGNAEKKESGVPNDQVRKHQIESNYVGANIGVTLNMEDYNSLRVDVWGTEEIRNNETRESAFSRLVKNLDDELNELVSKYKD